MIIYSLRHEMITIKQMLALERMAAKKGIFPITLMENAGKEICRVLNEKFDLSDKHLVVFAGTGNNAGDGFVAARYCLEHCPVIVLLFGEEKKLSEEAQENYDKIKESVTVIKVHNQDDLKEFHFQDDLQLVFLDAMLGTGIQGPLRQPISFGVDYFNSLEGIKVAVDVPSGTNPDSGEVADKTVDVDLIISLHDLKKGLVDMKEKTVVVDIGIPKNVAVPVIS